MDPGFANLPGQSQAVSASPNDSTGDQHLLTPGISECGGNKFLSPSPRCSQTSPSPRSSQTSSLSGKVNFAPKDSVQLTKAKPKWFQRRFHEDEDHVKRRSHLEAPVSRGGTPRGSVEARHATEQRSSTRRLVHPEGRTRVSIEERLGHLHRPDDDELHEKPSKENDQRHGGEIDTFGSEVWSLLSKVGTELIRKHADVLECDEREKDNIKQTNEMLRAELSRIRRAYQHCALHHDEEAPSVPKQPGMFGKELQSHHPHNGDADMARSSSSGSDSSESNHGFLHKIAGAGTALVAKLKRSGTGVFGGRSSTSSRGRLSTSSKGRLSVDSKRSRFSAADDSSPQDANAELVMKDERSSSGKMPSMISTRLNAIKRATGKLDDDEDGVLSREPSLCPHGSLEEDMKQEDIQIAATSEKKKVMRFADEEDRSEMNNFKLLPSWTGTDDEEQGAALVRSKTTRRNLEGDDVDDSDSDDDMAGDGACPGECLFRRFVMRGNSALVVLWSSIGYLLVFYDCVTLPLEFMDIDASFGFFKSISWMIRIYWTFHIPISMFTAHEQLNGQTDRRVRKVVRTYIRGWFLWDLLLASVDWVVGSVEAVSNMQTLRLLRMLRLSRLVQVRSMPGFLRRVVHANTASSTFWAVFKNVIMMVWFNHFAGCIWYSIGVSGDDGNNWLDLAERSGWNVESKEYIYVQAYRWQLANFVGESGLNPSTVSEFVYMMSTSVFAFVGGCMCVSSITSAMTRLEIAVANDAQRFAHLRQFLTENKISSKVATRVTQNAQFQAAQQKKKTPEHEIALLNVVSEPLRIDLHFEINMKIFGVHPFFAVYSVLSEHITRQICHTAVSRLHIARGDILFRAEECPVVPQIYFVVEGKIGYVHQSGEFKPWVKGKWACEPGLWTSWIHYGTARARCECDLALLSSESFQKLAMTDIEENKAFIIKYGAYIVHGLNETPPLRLTDLDDHEIDYGWLVQKSIPEEIDKRLKRKIAGVTKTLKRGNLSSTKTNTTIANLLGFTNLSSGSSRGPRGSLTSLSQSGSSRMSTSSTTSSRFDLSNSVGGYGGLRSQGGAKLTLSTNIVDNSGPSRRTRVAGVDLGIATDDGLLRNSFQSIISCDESYVSENRQSATSNAPSRSSAPGRSSAPSRDQTSIFSAEKYDAKRHDSTITEGIEEGYTSEAADADRVNTEEFIQKEILSIR